MVEGDGFMRITDEDREAEIKKRGVGVKARQLETIKKVEKLNVKELEKIREELAKKEPPRIEKLFITFRKDDDLRDVFVAVFTNPVCRYGELGLIERFKGVRQQAYRKLDTLREMDLIKFLSVADIRDKKLSKEDLAKEEKEVLKKFQEWSKTMTEKQKKMYLAKTNYYAPTEKGMNKRFLTFLINLKSEV